MAKIEAMIPDLDIYRTANVLVKHHGDDTLVVDARCMGPTLDERAGVDKPAPSSLISRFPSPGVGG